MRNLNSDPASRDVHISSPATASVFPGYHNILAGVKRNTAAAKSWDASSGRCGPWWYHREDPGTNVENADDHGEFPTHVPHPWLLTRPACLDGRSLPPSEGMSQTKGISRSRCTIEFLKGKSNGVYNRRLSRCAGFRQRLPRLAGAPAPAGAGRQTAALHTLCERRRFLPLDDFVKSRQRRRHSEKLRLPGARILRIEAYRDVRCNDER